MANSAVQTPAIAPTSAPTSGFPLFGLPMTPDAVQKLFACMANPFLANLCHTGDLPARVNTDGTDATPSVTETYLASLTVPGWAPVTGISLFNGSVAAGNITVYLIDAAGNLIAKSASTAMAGTDAYQRIPFTSAIAGLAPGTYFVLAQYNNTSARFNTHVFGDFPAGKLTGTVYGTFPTVTIPTTFTTGLGPIASLY